MLVTPEDVAAVSTKLRGGLLRPGGAAGGLAARARIQEGDILVGMHVGNRDWKRSSPRT